MVAELSESVNNVEESAVEIEALGDPGRPNWLPSRYARSRSSRCFDTENLFISVPFAVSVGFVIGADIMAPGLDLRPCDTVFTVTGDREGGPSLWYGTERSLRSFDETDDCRGRFFFFPKNDSIVH